MSFSLVYVLLRSSILFSFCGILSVLADCGSDNDRLLFETMDVTHGDVDYSQIFIKVLFTNAEWSSWEQLDNPSCDDFERGSIDTFDNFNDIEDIIAIKLRTNGNDGWALDSVGFRRYDNTYHTILTYFCNDIYIDGLPNECGISQASNSEYLCNNGNYAYDGFWIDSNDFGCNSVIFRFDSLVNEPIERLPYSLVPSNEPTKQPTLLPTQPTPSPTFPPPTSQPTVQPTVFDACGMFIYVCLFFICSFITILLKFI